MKKVRKKTYCHQNLNEWGPNGTQWGQKTEKGPHGDLGLQMGTHVGAVGGVWGWQKIDAGNKIECFPR